MNRIVIILLFFISALNLQAQQEICTSTEAKLYTISGTAGMNYHWHVPKQAVIVNAADTLNDSIRIVWQSANSYILTVDGDYNGCTISKSLIVKVKWTSIVDLGSDITFCKGFPPNPIQEKGYYSVIWNDTLTGPIYSLFDTTKTIWVRVVDSVHCSASDTLNITMFQPPKVKLPKDTSLCGFATKVLDAGNPGSTYLWTIKDSSVTGVSTETTQQITIAKGPKEIILKVTNNNNCSASDTLNIIACNVVFDSIPSAFTPNGDGINDTWYIKGLSDAYPKVVIQVYDRWGRLVYRSSPGYPDPWNGNDNSGPLPMDTYFFVVDFYGNGSSTHNGTITIIR